MFSLILCIFRTQICHIHIHTEPLAAMPNTAAVFQSGGPALGLPAHHLEQENLPVTGPVTTQELSHVTD